MSDSKMTIVVTCNASGREFTATLQGRGIQGKGPSRYDAILSVVKAAAVQGLPKEAKDYYLRFNDTTTTWEGDLTELTLRRMRGLPPERLDDW